VLDVRSTLRRFPLQRSRSQQAGPSAVTRWGPTLMRLRSASESHRAKYRPSGWTVPIRTSATRSESLYRSVFPRSASRFAEAPRHLSCGFAPFRVLPARPATRAAREPHEGLLSWSSAPLRRLSPTESTVPRLASPGPFRPQGLSPSRRLAPRSDLPALFRAGNALGVSPFRGFPPPPAPEARHPGPPS
jgi:hypothetical protein